MAKEQERLELISAVEAENHDELDNLAEKLDDVDTALHQAGSNNQDEVKINVDVDGLGSALAQLEAIDERLESIDDASVEIDGPNISGGDMAMATSGGRRGFPDEYEPDNEEDVLPRMSASLREFQRRSDILVGGGVDTGSGTVNLPETTLATTTNPETPFRAPFGQGRVADDRRQKELIDLLDDNAGLLQEQIDNLDATDKLFGDTTVDTSVNEMRDLYGVDVPDLEDDMKGFDDIPDGGHTLRDTLGEVSDELKDFRFTMGTFHDLFAAMIPIFGVFVGAIPAAVTGLVALGGAALIAAGALAGIGVLGAAGLSLQESGELSFGPINKALSDVRDSFVDAFAPLAQSLAPVFRDLLTRLEMMAGPLATAAGGLRSFTDEFRGLAQFASGALPSLLNNSLEFAHSFVPLLAEIGGFVVQKDIFGFLSTQLQTALPALRLLGASLIEIIPALIHLSQGFLAVAAGISVAFGIVSAFANTFPLLTSLIGIAIGALLTYATATTLYSIATGFAETATYAFARSIVVGAVSALSKGVAALATYTGMSYAATAATVALISAVTLGVGAVALMSSGFVTLGDNINRATSSLRNFGNALGLVNRSSLDSVGGGFGNGGRAGVYRDNSTTVINAGDRDSAARQQYSSEYERAQHVDSVFGG